MKFAIDPALTDLTWAIYTYIAITVFGVVLYLFARKMERRARRASLYGSAQKEVAMKITLLEPSEVESNWTAWVSLDDYDPPLGLFTFVIARGSTKEKATANARRALVRAIGALPQPEAVTWVFQ